MRASAIGVRDGSAFVAVRAARSFVGHVFVLAGNTAVRTSDFTVAVGKVGVHSGGTAMGSGGTSVSASLSSVGTGDLLVTA